MGNQGDRQRLVAILAADAAGYSRLMTADERGAVAALDAARRIFRNRIESHQGRVVDMAGDSVLAVFDAVASAVAAAVDVQRDLAAAGDSRLKFRIAVHLGDIIEKGDGTVYGDGVNVAARLQSLAEPGEVAVSAMVRETLGDRAAVTFEDKGERQVKNIARPLRFFLVASGAARRSGTPPPLPDRPSIAVLPFDNISGDPEQGYFADGMAEDVITLLSGVPYLFVIARNSTFAYKGRSSDIRQTAAELGVRYVLEGSVRKSGSRIRITAQLIDAGSGSHLWAEKYDRETVDIFAVQDEVAQGIVGALQSRVLDAEFRLAQRKPPESLDAWGNVVQAKMKLFAFRRQDIDEAEPFARKAVEIDPNYAAAHAVLGHLLVWRSYNGWTDDWYRTAKEAASHCDHAMSLAPNDAAVLADVGSATWTMGRFIKAVPVLERAVAFSPNSAIACAYYGAALACVGRTEEGAAHAKRALRLSPRDSVEHLFLTLLASIEFLAGRFELAKQATDRALQTHPDYVAALMYRAAACSRLGQPDEARLLLAKVERLSPRWAVDSIFRPRTEGTIWTRYSDAIREVMDREPSPYTKN